MFDENRQLAEGVIFSIFAAFTDTCAGFAQQMEFGFEEDLKEISEQIKEQFA